MPMRLESRYSLANATQLLLILIFFLLIATSTGFGSNDLPQINLALQILSNNPVWPPGQDLPQSSWVCLNRLRSGSGRFADNMHKMGLATSPLIAEQHKLSTTLFINAPCTNPRMVYNHFATPINKQQNICHIKIGDLPHTNDDDDLNADWVVWTSWYSRVGGACWDQALLIFVTTIAMCGANRVQVTTK